MTDYIQWGIAAPLTSPDILLTADDLGYVLTPSEAEEIGSRLVEAARNKVSNTVRDLVPGALFVSNGETYVRGFRDRVSGAHHEYRVEDFAPPLHTDIEVIDSD